MDDVTPDQHDRMEKMLEGLRKPNKWDFPVMRSTLTLVKPKVYPKLRLIKGGKHEGQRKSKSVGVNKRIRIVPPEGL
jgi:hypothetical protein